MASAQLYPVIRGSGTSSGTTPLDLVTWAIPSGSSVSVEVVATGRDTTTGDTVSRRVATSAKNVAGVAGMIGAVATLLTVSDAALATATLTVAASGGNLTVSVTGVLTKTLDWEARVIVQVN